MDGSDLPPGGSGQKPPSGPPGTSRKRKRGADASPATPAGASPTTARRSKRLARASPATPAGAGPTSPSPTTARRSKRSAGASPATPAGSGPSSSSARRSKRNAGASPATPAGSGPSSSAAKSKRRAGASPANSAGAGPSSLSPTTARRSSKLVKTSAVSAWVRGSAAGTLWRTTSVHGRGCADKETMREAILYVRRERSVLAPDDPASPYNEPTFVAATTLTWVRSAGAGALWNTPGRDHADKKTMREAVLHMRREHSVLAPDNPASPYNEPTFVAATTLTWVRSAGAGALWNTPGRDHADKKTMREAVLHVRREHSILAPDNPASPYARPRRRGAYAESGPAPTRVLRPRASR